MTGCIIKVSKQRQRDYINIHEQPLYRSTSLKLSQKDNLTKTRERAGNVPQNSYILFYLSKIPWGRHEYMIVFVQMYIIMIRHLKRHHYPRWLEWCHFRLCRALMSVYVTGALIWGQLFGCFALVKIWLQREETDPRRPASGEPDMEGLSTPRHNAW